MKLPNGEAWYGRIVDKLSEHEERISRLEGEVAGMKELLRVNTSWTKATFAAVVTLIASLLAIIVQLLWR